MGNSKLKIPKVCEHCGKPFEAKTVITRFCSKELAQMGKTEQEQSDAMKRYISEVFIPAYAKISIKAWMPMIFCFTEKSISTGNVPKKLPLCIVI